VKSFKTFPNELLYEISSLFSFLGNFKVVNFAGIERIFFIGMKDDNISYVFPMA
jgi:hypothetical protein